MSVMQRTSPPSRSDAVGSVCIAAEKVTGEPVLPTASLVEFTGNTGDMDSGLPYHFSDYLELVDWTGRAIRSDKRGYIPEGVPPILIRLGLEADNWIETVRHFRRHFYDFVGPANILMQQSQTAGRRWFRGFGACRRLLTGGTQMAMRCEGLPSLA